LEQEQVKWEGEEGGAREGIKRVHRSGAGASVKVRAGQLHTLYMSALQEKQARM
jgi:hypothetical protein